mgnify:CR=1 FL=1
MEFKQAKTISTILGERSNTQKFAALGLILSLAMFFNYPTLLEVFLWTGGLTAVMTLTGYSLDRFGRKGLAVLPAIVVPAIFLISASGCLLGLPHYFPKANMFTGEVQHGQWDGFRIKHCDKGRMPWYYQELPEDRKSEMSRKEKWNETLYCIDSSPQRMNS